MKFSLSLPLRLRVAGMAFPLALGALACGGHDGGERAPGVDYTMGGATGSFGPSGGDPCSKPTEGCPCSTPGQSVECGSVVRDRDGYVTCTIGFIECQEDEIWGPCLGDQFSLLPVPDTGAN